MQSYRYFISLALHVTELCDAAIRIEKIQICDLAWEQCGRIQQFPIADIGLTG